VTKHATAKLAVASLPRPTTKDAVAKLAAASLLLEPGDSERSPQAATVPFTAHLSEVEGGVEVAAPVPTPVVPTEEQRDRADAAARS
jgi:hypothetical protein